MIDFYASWCESCNRLDRDVFTNEQVASLMKHFVLIRIDLTAHNPELLELARNFNVIGPPALIFFNRTGTELQTRLYGDVTSDGLSKILIDILQK
jgi:thiol:disulfide interchange protein DsbD